MKLSKKAQIEQRRALVLELFSQGMSQDKIAGVLKPDVLNISQQTVSRDIEYLEKNRIEYVKRNREQMAKEYQQTYTNLKTLRRDIWEHYREFKAKNEIDNMIALVPIIEDIEQSIHNVICSGHHIERELIEYGKEESERLEQKMNRVVAKSQY